MPTPPLRRCRVCRKQLPKAQMARWTVADGVLTQDPPQTAPGRGYYSCTTKCEEILPKTIKGLKKA